MLMPRSKAICLGVIPRANLRNTACSRSLSIPAVDAVAGFTCAMSRLRYSLPAQISRNAIASSSVAAALVT